MTALESGHNASPWLEPLAQWVAELDALALPPRVLERVAHSAIDWWGAVAKGCRHRLADRYRCALADSLGPEGNAAQGCSVAGRPGLYRLEQAAAANAAISHLAEVDDGHKQAVMHPAVTVFPAVIALAEYYQLELADMQAAVVAGYEVGLKVGALLGKNHYTVCHTTATAGSFGAAAAAARLLKLSQQQTLYAFGHAGTQAAGLWQLLDDKAEEAKAFHPAAAIRNGLTAVSLARSGLPAATRILEGPRGMLKAWGLDGDASSLVVPDGTCYQIETTTLKGWPVCGQMHTSLDALSDLLPTIPAADQVKRIRVSAPLAQLNIADVRNPQSFEEAKFSSRLCLAFLLRNRSLDFANFTPQAVTSAELRALMDRIVIEENQDFTNRFPKERPARVEVTMKTGAQLVRERNFRRGDPEQPWQWQELVDRFHALTPQLDSASRQTLVSWCAACGRSAGKIGNIKALFNCLMD